MLQDATTATTRHAGQHAPERMPPSRLSVDVFVLTTSQTSPTVTKLNKGIRTPLFSYITLRMVVSAPLKSGLQLTPVLEQTFSFIALQSRRGHRWNQLIKRSPKMTSKSLRVQHFFFFGAKTFFGGSGGHWLGLLDTIVGVRNPQRCHSTRCKSSSGCGLPLPPCCTIFGTPSIELTLL